eukprot:1252186-Pyramimonas_sp.AAC.1
MPIRAATAASGSMAKCRGWTASPPSPVPCWKVPEALMMSSTEGNGTWRSSMLSQSQPASPGPADHSACQGSISARASSARPLPVKDEAAQGASSLIHRKALRPPCTSVAVL